MSVSFPSLTGIWWWTVLKVFQECCLTVLLVSIVLVDKQVQLWYVSKIHNWDLIQSKHHSRPLILWCSRWGRNWKIMQIMRLLKAGIELNWWNWFPTIKYILHLTISRNKGATSLKIVLFEIFKPLSPHSLMLPCCKSCQHDTCSIAFQKGSTFCCSFFCKNDLFSKREIPTRCLSNLAAVYVQKLAKAAQLAV